MLVEAAARLPCRCLHRVTTLQAAMTTLQGEVGAAREEANRYKGIQQRYIDSDEQRVKALYIKASYTC